MMVQTITTIHQQKSQYNIAQVDPIREHFNNQKMLSQIKKQIRLICQVNLIQQGLKKKCWSIYQHIFNMDPQSYQWLVIQFYLNKFNFGNNTQIHIKQEQDFQYLLDSTLLFKICNLLEHLKLQLMENLCTLNQLQVKCQLQNILWTILVLQNEKIKYSII
ncbi:unnamed protein product [Paramecium sonneborni]|uniref:Uncharacterized protein n=1 Tax=Paramecium sonneborni TaxID=65129 RepID=A0A8S1PIY5_9CILI|nr:unnamed protein product [Paramecium sonneborni]